MKLLSQAKIRTARNVFTKNKDGTILNLLHAYNIQNDFNQIPHVVGSNIEHSPGGQSFETRTSVAKNHSTGYACLLEGKGILYFVVSKSFTILYINIKLKIYSYISLGMDNSWENIFLSLRWTVIVWTSSNVEQSSKIILLDTRIWICHEQSS